MHWNYRIVKDDHGPEYEGEPIYSLRECFYNDEKKIAGFTANPIDVLADTPEGIIEVLEMMLRDAKKSVADVLDEKGFEFAPFDGEDEIPPESEN
jgi:hypothetical protein